MPHSVVSGSSLYANHSFGVSQLNWAKAPCKILANNVLFFFQRLQDLTFSCGLSADSHELLSLFLAV